MNLDAEFFDKLICDFSMARGHAFKEKDLEWLVLALVNQCAPVQAEINSLAYQLDRTRSERDKAEAILLKCQLRLDGTNKSDELWEEINNLISGVKEK